MDDLSMDLLRLAGRGYCCAQIMLKLALAGQGRENPELVAAMAGLCDGAGDREGTCGVLTGGACLIALQAAKGADHEAASDRLPLLLAEYREWFAATVGGRFGGSSCAAIAGEGPPDQAVCGGLLAEAYRFLAGLLPGRDWTGGGRHG